MKDCFEKLTVILMADKEVALLKKTVEEILTYCGTEDIDRIVVFLKDSACPSYQTAKELSETVTGLRIDCVFQRDPDVISAVAEIPEYATGTHFVIMVSDMEMPPDVLAEMIAVAKENPRSIVCGAKWVKGSVVNGYGFFHRFSNRAVNLAVSLMYGKKFKDLFSIFQIYPKEVYEQMDFRDPKTFLFEYTLRPIKENINYIEIPTHYQPRADGRSHFKFPFLFRMASRYLRCAVRIRFFE